MRTQTNDATARPQVDSTELEAKVKAMYRAVAEDPHGSYHFELGRDLAERLGYPPELLDKIPLAAVESFAGVGYFFDLADLKRGEEVLDLGSGSGMDVFYAAQQVGESGRVVGIDMTQEQLAKAERLRAEAGLSQVTFREGHIEDLPFPDESFDVVISNGVINLAPDKKRVFAEAARVLRPGGRITIADIVAEVELTARIVADTDLWASCIGGAAQQDAYREALEASGMRLELMKRNEYRFLSQQALNASERYRVKSVSVLARKAERKGIGS
jgi:ubiquinone/menaquinone biosynthesis C-methylase UbiE